MSVAEATMCASAEDLESSFLLLRHRILESVSELAESGPATDFARRHIRGWRASNEAIDYNTLALGFNQAYFFKNLYKNMLLLSALRSEIHDLTSAISDVGAGAGTASIAWLTMSGYQPSSWFVIDTSIRQLTLAQRLLSLLFSKSFSLVCGDANQRRELLHGTVLASYWLCEQDPDSFADHHPFAEAQQIFLLDYPDAIVAAMKSLASSHYHKMITFQRSLRAPMRNILGADVIDVVGCYATKR